MSTRRLAFFRCHADPATGYLFLSDSKCPNGIQVLAAACLALTQRGDGSNPSDPIVCKWGRYPTGLRKTCPWPSGPGVCLPSRTGGFDSRRALLPISSMKSEFFDNAARNAWPGRQPADHPHSERGMLGVRIPLGLLAQAPWRTSGVVVTLSMEMQN